MSVLDNDLDLVGMHFRHPIARHVCLILLTHERCCRPADEA